MFVQQSKDKQLYLSAGQGPELFKYLKEMGFVEKKKENDSTFFKKPGLNWNPFRYTVVKESTFYTLIIASSSVLEKIPEHLDKIRQPLH